MASATTTTTEDSDGLTKCSICLEQFKTPRFLPCLHSFCHGCLTSYIQTSCRSKENPVGFQCPLCKKFTPGPSTSVHPMEWSKHFPINQILSEFSNQNDLMCGACRRDGEGKGATDYCISCMEALCDNCSKYHKKNLASSNHKLCTVTDLQKRDVLTMVSLESKCLVHKDRPIELYCNDHEEPCCTMCVSTKHRKCDSVETIEEKAKKLRENKAYESLLVEVKETEKCLCTIKRKQEENISKFEDNSNKVREEINDLDRKIAQHIERLKNASLDQISRLTKEGKEAMTKKSEALSDQIQLIHFCETELKKASSQTDVEFVVGYRKQKQMVENLSKAEKFPLCITLNSVIPENLKCFEKTPKFAELTMLQSAQKLFVKRPTEVVKYFEARIEKAQITGLINERNGIILFTNNLSSQSTNYHTGMRNVQKRKLRKGSEAYGLNLMEYHFSDDKLRLKENMDIQGRSYGIVRVKERLFVSGIEQGILVLFGLDIEYDALSRIYMGDSCYGLTSWKDSLYVACSDKIHKMDLDGNVLRTYPTLAGVRHVVATDCGLLVFSNIHDDIVRAINDNGDALWSYQRSNLRKPKGVSKDSLNNIYVSSFSNHSVHVLTSKGILQQVFENIPNPIFFELIEERNVAVVCSDYEKIILYKTNREKNCNPWYPQYHTK